MAVSHGCFLLLVVLSLLALSLPHAFAVYDETSLCVADITSPVRLVNGFACKDLKNIGLSDFFTSNITVAGNIRVPGGPGVQLGVVTPTVLPGLNAAGVSVIRGDFEPNSFFNLHFNHGGEVGILISGKIEAGLLLGSTLIKQVLRNPLDMYYFPPRTIHYNKCLGNTPCTALALLTSGNVRPEFIADSAFNSTPKLSMDILTSSFKSDVATMTKIMKNFM